MYSPVPSVIKYSKLVAHVFTFHVLGSNTSRKTISRLLPSRAAGDTQRTSFSQIRILATEKGKCEISGNCRTAKPAAADAGSAHSQEDDSV